MPYGEGTDPPPRRDHRERLQDEASLRELRMGNGQSPRTELAAAPQDDIQVKDARAPAAAGPASEFALEGLEPSQHLGRIKLALDQRNGIGKVAARPAVSSVEDDRRRIEQ